MTRRLAPIGIGAVAAALFLPAAAAPARPEDGGTFRIVFPIGAAGAPVIDPALGRQTGPECGTLMAYPDKPPPEGYALAPDLAEGDPVVSEDRRTYTFTIRKNARFSTGAPVAARSFSHALERILTPAMHSLSASQFGDIVGARRMLAGQATTLAGAVARGRTLILRLTTPSADLEDRLTGLCAVPPNLPADPEGAKAPLPSPAPYYVAEYVPNERIVLERNRFYRGKRPHHVDRFVIDLSVGFDATVDQVAEGTADTIGVPGPIFAHSADLAHRYGVNKSRFFVRPGLAVRVFHLNTRRPLFRNNVELRQAVNFAVDRTAIAREDGVLVSTPTDQYLVPGMPGYRDAHIYPLAGPDLRKARALAKGHTRGGKATLYTLDDPVDIAQAQILQRNLGQIGLTLEIKRFPSGSLVFQKLVEPGEPFDLARVRWFFSPDPWALDCLFNGRMIGQPGSCNFSYFDSPRYNGLLDRASRLNGTARYRAYGRLDVQLSRDAAPAIPIARLNAVSFVSARVGCVVLNPFLDLTAVCLK